MLGEDKVRNLEDLTNLEVKREGEIIKEENIEVKENKDIENIENKENIEMNENKADLEHKCYPLNYPLNIKMEQNNVITNPLKKKENPALLPPDCELIRNKDNNLICCVQHSQLPVNAQEKDPRYYQGMPPCMLATIISAGKPSHVLAPLNLFSN